MKTRLLRKLRREARELFKFKITYNSDDTYAIVELREKWIASFFNGAYNLSCRELATRYCKDHIRGYILGRVNELRLKQYDDKRRKKRVL